MSVFKSREQALPPTFPLQKLLNLAFISFLICNNGGSYRIIISIEYVSDSHMLIAKAQDMLLYNYITSSPKWYRTEWQSLSLGSFQSYQIADIRPCLCSSFLVISPWNCNSPSTTEKQHTPHYALLGTQRNFTLYRLSCFPFWQLQGSVLPILSYDYVSLPAAKGHLLFEKAKAELKWTVV